MTPIEERAHAHVELETDTCDVSVMANVCRVLIERFQEELRGLEITGLALLSQSN